MFNLTRMFVQHVIEMRSVIYELVKRDFQQQYMGSYLGAIWVFLQPMLYVLVLYTVFTIGFRAGASVDMPFSLYLISGIIAWSYFSVNFSANTEIVQKYSYMVKRVNFRLSILPVVKLLSSMIPHVFLLLIAIAISWYQGYAPTVYTLQLIYYFAAMFIMLLGLAWLTCSSNIFVKDVSKVVSVINQFGFWLTPIFWNIGMIPERYRWIITDLNPMYYIVTGYRDSIVSGVPFWERGNSLHFWIFTLVIVLVGIRVFSKLRPHIAEVV